MSALSNSPTPKRKRKRTNNRNSTLKTEFDHTINLPGGIRRTLDLLRNAPTPSIDTLPPNYSPLVSPILLAGSTYTRRYGNRIPSNLIPTILELIQSCHDRNISLNGGNVMGGDQFHRPLILAAYYGFVPLVHKLLTLGAKADMADGMGRTALHAALQNPAGQPHFLRECDRNVARLLLEQNVVTPHLTTWRRRNNHEGGLGSIIYASADSISGSILLMSIKNKNWAAVSFLVLELGVTLTDRDYLDLYRGGHLQRKLMPAIAVVRMEMNKGGGVDASSSLSWSKDVAWSYPPTWNVAVALCGGCGLPEDVFRNHIVPYCSREWFYSDDMLLSDKPLPPRLAASMGSEDRDMLSRGEQWRDFQRNG
uniref:Uncharacterized protein n=1 Tax=Ditylum brightwellii TaxID=49249 RepID=A0A7S4T9J6_9STRA